MNSVVSDRITLTYLEFLDEVRTSYERIALNEIFGIEKDYVDIGFQEWINDFSIDEYYVYMQYILTLPARQEHLDVRSYVFCKGREVFFNLINTLFEIGYYSLDVSDEIQFITEMVEEFDSNNEYKKFNMKSVVEEFERIRKFYDKVNDET